MRSILKVNWDSNLPIYNISQSELQKKGIDSLLLDVDGTLVNRKSNMIPKAVKNWIIESNKLFSLYLISNNPSKKRIAKIARELNLRYKYKASKPRKKNNFVCYQRNWQRAKKYSHYWRQNFYRYYCW